MVHECATVAADCRVSTGCVIRHLARINTKAVGKLFVVPACLRPAGLRLPVPVSAIKGHQSPDVLRLCRPKFRPVPVKPGSTTAHQPWSTHTSVHVRRLTHPHPPAGA